MSGNGSSSAGASAIPGKHTSRACGPDQWTGRGNDLAARPAATPRAGWLYGFQIVRARSIPPAKDQRASMPAMRRPPSPLTPCCACLAVADQPT
jgi:hypothetical protein